MTLRIARAKFVSTSFRGETSARDASPSRISTASRLPFRASHRISSLLLQPRVFSISGKRRTVNGRGNAHGCVREAREGLRALSSQLGAPDSDANNLPPLMTEEKQCAGFNTGSESGLRSCVVGGPLSTERGAIAAAATAAAAATPTASRAAGAASHGFTVSWLPAPLAFMGTQ